jgi:hypothetical protein
VLVLLVLVLVLFNTHQQQAPPSSLPGAINH